ncbi:Hint domain-containing protein [Acidocella sp.]|uniref:Hint domain-containing protein n=1 Tax=Acidocella sp. TaxID=50710 RepID=UPI002629ECED|nr:Hint domain-containing protein [Acidocella sp.]
MSSTTYSFATVLNDLQTLDGQIGSSGLTSAQAASLQTLLQDVAANDGTVSYVYSILDEVVASGGAAGDTKAQLTGLVNTWFLGTNDPTPLTGAAMVSQTGSSLFPADIATAYMTADQGYNNGDCWLVAAAMETDAVNPSALSSMLWENSNGTYGVRFCSPTGYVYVTVNSDLMYVAGGGYYESAYTTDGSIWIGVLEKAFVEAEAAGLTFPMTEGQTVANNYTMVSNGGWDEMMLAMTGRMTTQYQLDNLSALASGGAVYNQILYDTQHGLDVMFASNTNTSYGLMSSHMFAVLGVDQSTGDYILYNPWGYAEVGGTYTTAQVKFEVTATQLYNLYTSGTGDEFLAADGAYYFSPAVCHLAGTRIETPTGERLIESLRAGDEVVTRFGGGQRIKWIGEQHYDGRFIAGNREKLPIRLQAGALGGGLPRRDLWLSPGHSLLLDGILVLARDLLNGVTITQEAPGGIVSYYNIELEAHDCVLAEGSWSETYADCLGLRNCFHNAASFRARFGDVEAPDEPALCAPRPREGERLAHILARTVMLAEARVTPGPVLGCVERIGEVVSGWAFAPTHPDLPVRLELYEGARLIGSALAMGERPDVRDAGFGAGRAGFGFAISAPAYPACISVRHAATGAVLPVSEAVVIRARAA